MRKMLTVTPLPFLDNPRLPSLIGGMTFPGGSLVCLYVYVCMTVSVYHEPRNPPPFTAAVVFVFMLVSFPDFCPMSVQHSCSPCVFLMVH